MTREIKHQVIIKAAPKAVFDALMNGKKHAKFTGAPARISSKTGGPFTCYNGYIKGINLELKRGRLIVQSWHSQNWPEETWSVIAIKLAKLAGGKTKLSFTQAGVPANDYARKNAGWRTHYWEPLKRFLERGK